MRKFIPLFLLLPITVAAACLMYFPISWTPLLVLRIRIYAVSGNDAAQYHLGWLYLNGVKGLPKDEKEAAKWFFKSAQKDNVRAETSLGYMYEQGLGGLPQDSVQAVTWYKKAAVQGFSSAQVGLAQIYENGRDGVPQNESQAEYWLRAAADQGDPGGMNDLAWLYATSSNPAMRKPEAALLYAKKAVDKTRDHPSAAILDTLAEAYYVNGRYDDAVITERQALALLANSPPERKRDFEARFEKYQKAAGGHGQR